MHELTLLIEIAMALAVAFLGGVVARRLGLPTIVGYLLGGIVIGPALLVTGRCMPREGRISQPTGVISVPNQLSINALPTFECRSLGIFAISSNWLAESR